ncbi:MAG: hypothetical protein KDA87_01475 [Planctomycetales bacterium]|nr:hypothetical protein [Planctomycetales bacterium]
MKPVTKRKKPGNTRQYSIEQLETKALLTSTSLLPFDQSTPLLVLHDRPQAGQLAQMDISSGEFANLGEASGLRLEAAGIRSADGYAYALEANSNQVVRIGANGAVEVVGSVAGMPNATYTAGDFGPDGLLYAWSGARPREIIGIDVEQLQVVRTIELSDRLTDLPDFTFHEPTGLFYGVNSKGRQTGHFVSIDLSSGPDAGLVAKIGAAVEREIAYGAAFSDVDGRVFLADNGSLYEFNVASGERSYVGKAPRATTLDGLSFHTSAVNLAPLALDSSFQFDVGSLNNLLNLPAPSDPDGDDLMVSVASLPTLGQLRFADGTAVTLNDIIDIETLQSLRYDAPASYDGSASPGSFVYLVADAEYQVSATAHIHLNAAPVVQLDPDQNQSHDGKFTVVANSREWVRIADVDAQVSDEDDTHLAMFTVQVDGIRDGDEEQLRIGDTSITLGRDSQQTVSFGSLQLNVEFEAISGQLAIHNVDSASEMQLSVVQNLLRKIEYQHSAERPTQGNRSFAIYVNDGSLDSVVQRSVIQVAAAAQQFQLINGSFEQPNIDDKSPVPLNVWFNSNVKSVTYLDEDVPGWHTTATDHKIELWQSGFSGVTAAEGRQFAELNAEQQSTLYQIIDVHPNSTLAFEFFHRGRSGTDTMQVTAMDVASGEVLFAKQYHSPASEWSFYEEALAVPNNATSVQLSFEAVATASGNTTVGNLLDGVRLFPLSAAADVFYASEVTSVVGNLLANDNDWQPQTIASVAAVNGVAFDGSHTLTLDSGAVVTVHNDGLFQFEPNGAYGDLEFGQSAVESISYIMDDGDGHFDTQWVTVQIDGVSLGSLSGRIKIYGDTDDGLLGGLAFNNTVTLTGITDAGGTVERSVETDVDGNYGFSGLAAGTYQLSQQQPPQVLNAGTAVGTAGGVAADTAISAIRIPAAGGNFTGYDFNEYAPAKISGFVFLDQNADRLLDEQDLGVTNVIVEISGTDDLGQAVQFDTQTDAFGFYEFAGLRPGEYQISVDSVSGLQHVLASAGSGGGSVGDGLVEHISLGAGDIAQHNDFGMWQLNALSGSVYLDNDWDGVFESDDTALPGISVRLSGFDVDGNAVVRETKTDDSGHYLFAELPAGTYQIQETQPDGLSSGRNNVGTFAGQGGQQDRNGVRADDSFQQIQLIQGDQGIGYDFSERLQYEFASLFTAEITFEGTEADDVIEFIASTDGYWIRLNGQVTQLDTSEIYDFKFVGRGGHDHVTVVGTSLVEQVDLRAGSMKFLSPGFMFRAFHTEEITVDAGGGFDRAFIYDTPEDDQVYADENTVRLTSNDVLNQALGFHRSYVYSTAGGADQARLVGSNSDDTLRANDKNARLFNHHVYNFVSGFAEVIADANQGGHDVAQIWDSSGDDRFELTVGEIQATYAAARRTAIGFESVDAYALAGGKDSAVLFDTAGDDVYVASPSRSGLTGTGYSHQVHYFDHVTATASDGMDTAYLYDSLLDDTFVTNGNEAALYNSAYSLKAIGFDSVDGFSSQGGDDRAYFTDTLGDDTFVSLDKEARMYGQGYDHAAHGFYRVYAVANAGGVDKAILYDTDQADTLAVNDVSARIFGDGYYAKVSLFESVDTYFSDFSRHDRAFVFGAISQDKLDAAGPLAEVMSQHGANYIYNPDVLVEVDDAELESDWLADSDLLPRT